MEVFNKKNNLNNKFKNLKQNKNNIIKETSKQILRIILVSIYSTKYIV